MSLMRRHQEKIRQQLAKGESPTVVTANAASQSDEPLEGLTAWQKEHKQQMESLSLARVQIKSIASHSARAALKRDEYLPTFVEYLNRYRESEQTFENPIITQVVVWAFDAQEIELALEWADFAQKSGQVAMPEEFSSSLEAFVARALFDWIEPQFKEGHSIEPYFGQIYDQISGWDLHDELAAKYHKLKGLCLMAEDVLDMDERRAALACFEKAEALYPKIGVGTRIKKLTEQLAKAEALDAVDTSATDSSTTE